MAKKGQGVSAESKLTKDPSVINLDHSGSSRYGTSGKSNYPTGQ